MKLVIRDLIKEPDRIVEVWLEKRGDTIVLISNRSNETGTAAIEARIKDTGEICLIRYGNFNHGDVEGI